MYRQPGRTEPSYNDIDSPVAYTANQPGVQPQLPVQRLVEVEIRLYEQIDITAPGRIIDARTKQPYLYVTTENVFDFFFDNCGTCLAQAHDTILAASVTGIMDAGGICIVTWDSSRFAWEKNVLTVGFRGRQCLFLAELRRSGAEFGRLAHIRSERGR